MTRSTRMRLGFRRTALLTATLLVVPMLALVTMPNVAQAASANGAVISNGTVQLGVGKLGDLNYNCSAFEASGCPDPSAEEGESTVGIRYQPLNLDAISPGCPCEGWGVADAGSGLTGYANQSAGDGNVTAVSFTAPSDHEAIAVTQIADPTIAGYELQVTQDYAPSPVTANLFQDTVTIKNTGTQAVTDLRYRRAMDWDVEPPPSPSG